MEKKPHPALAAVRAAFPSTVPVLTGYLVLGIACLLMGVMLLVDHIRKEREEKAKKQDAADTDKE